MIIHPRLSQSLYSTWAIYANVPSSSVLYPQPSRYKSETTPGASSSQLAWHESAARKSRQPPAPATISRLRLPKSVLVCWAAYVSHSAHFFQDMKPRNRVPVRTRRLSSFLDSVSQTCTPDCHAGRVRKVAQSDPWEPVNAGLFCDISFYYISTVKLTLTKNATKNSPFSSFTDSCFSKFAYDLLHTRCRFSRL